MPDAESTSSTRESTWAGNHAYAYRRWERPTSVEELAALVRSAEQVRAVGSRHSFNDLCDSADLAVDLTGMASAPVVDAERRTVTVTPGTRFAEIAPAAAAAGLALRNMGSLPHISAVGAASTGTHGSGVGNQVLAASVSRVRLMDADGETTDHRRGDPGFEGMVCALGTVGLVVELELDLVPEFWVEQTRELEEWSTALPRIADLLTEGYSVSVFTDWTDAVPTEVLRKAQVDRPGPETVARTTRSPASRLLGEGENLTELDRPLPWLEGLPHFRLDHQPSFGEEIQSEFFVPQDRTVEALEAVTAIRDEMAPLLILSELRSIAADDLWLSPAQGRDTTCLHFTWRLDPEAVHAINRRLMEVLAAYDVRPHWGKVFDRRDLDAARLWPHLDDFRALRRRLDPEGRFANAFVREALGPL